MKISTLSINRYLCAVEIFRSVLFHWNGLSNPDMVMDGRTALHSRASAAKRSREDRVYRLPLVKQLLRSANPGVLVTHLSVGPSHQKKGITKVPSQDSGLPADTS